MKRFLLHKGIERPMACRITYLGSEVYCVQRNKFSTDDMLQFLGTHSASLYERDVLTYTDYEHLTVEVVDWSVVGNSLIMPVIVKDQEERRYVYRLDANTDIIDSTALYFAQAASLPAACASKIPQIDIENNLLFSNPNVVLDALYREAYPMIEVRSYYLRPFVGATLIDKQRFINSPQNRALYMDVHNHAKSIIRADWKTPTQVFDFDIIAEVSVVGDIIDIQGDGKRSIPKPKGCLSTIQQLHCFVYGKYFKNLSYRVEVHAVE